MLTRPREVMEPRKCARHVQMHATWASALDVRNNASASAGGAAGSHPASPNGLHMEPHVPCPRTRGALGKTPGDSEAMSCAMPRTLDTQPQCLRPGQGRLGRCGALKRFLRANREWHLRMPRPCQGDATQLPHLPQGVAHPPPPGRIPAGPR